MPSGVRIDWSFYDQRIIDDLPKMTIVQLANELGLHYRSLGDRARKLGIVPAPKSLTNTQKKLISDQFLRPLTEEQKQFILVNYQILARKTIARKLVISYYRVNQFMKSNCLETSEDMMDKAMLEGARIGAPMGAMFLKEKLATDPEFAAQFSEKRREISKTLWQDEFYRLKVRNGIRKIYADTDLRERLSSIGKERFASDPGVREILLAPRSCKTSKLNDDVAIVLDSYGIEYEREFEINNYHFDFKIGSILLEVNGDFWHQQPHNIKNDRAKATIIQMYHSEYDLRIIWEREFRSVRGQERLLEILGMITKEPTIISLEMVGFGIAEVQLVNRFLTSFHYLGQTNRHKYCYGAYVHGELIAVACFGQLIRQNITKLKAIELVRLCRHPHFFNHNLMSRFLAWCCREIKKLKKYEIVISYADTTLHHGTIYRACNWTDEGLCQQDYQYLSDTGVPMHKKTLYNRAKAAGVTEREFAELNGFSKVFAGQKNRFILKLM